MGVVSYLTVNGEVMSETRNGVERDYVPDPLGSTAALLDNTQTKTDTITYWPYGEERTSTGSNPTPYRFVGTLGYRKETSIRTYVRARHYRTDQGRWMRRDPLWPKQSPFGFVDGSPLVNVDPTGQFFCPTIAFGYCVGLCAGGRLWCCGCDVEFDFRTGALIVACKCCEFKLPHYKHGWWPF